MKAIMSIGVGLLLCLLTACDEYTPKPKGYFRIDLDATTSCSLCDTTLPYQFSISEMAIADTLVDVDANWINLYYPSIRVHFYGSYFPFDVRSLDVSMQDNRKLIGRLAKHAAKIQEHQYENPEAKVYGSLFYLDNESISPVQFMLTDSVGRFFRGAFYYDRPPNPDSIAPVADYLKQEEIQLIQAFS